MFLHPGLLVVLLLGLSLAFVCHSRFVRTTAARSDPHVSSSLQEAWSKLDELAKNRLSRELTLPSAWAVM